MLENEKDKTNLKFIFDFVKNLPKKSLLYFYKINKDSEEHKSISLFITEGRFDNYFEKASFILGLKDLKDGVLFIFNENIINADFSYIEKAYEQDLSEEEMTYIENNRGIFNVYSFDFNKEEEENKTAIFINNREETEDLLLYNAVEGKRFNNLLLNFCDININ